MRAIMWGRFGEGGAEAAVVGDVVEGQDAALAILRPFLGGTVAADGEVPRLRRDAFEMLVRVYPDPARFVVGGLGVARPFDRIASGARKHGWGTGVVVHQVERGEAPARQRPSHRTVRVYAVGKTGRSRESEGSVSDMHRAIRRP